MEIDKGLGGKMLNIDKIIRQDRLLRATTGLNRKAFEHLLPRFEQVYQSSLQTSKPSRIRKIGAGRKSHLKTIKHKLFGSIQLFD